MCGRAGGKRESTGTGTEHLGSSVLLHLLASAKRGKAPKTSVCDIEKGCVSFALQNVLFLPFLVIVHSSLKKKVILSSFHWKTKTRTTKGRWKFYDLCLRVAGATPTVTLVLCQVLWPREGTGDGQALPLREGSYG